MYKGSRLASADGAPISVPLARSLLSAAFQALEARKQEVNDLNVYPVPDGDTGTNLALTSARCRAVGKLPDNLSGRDLCSAISQAALMGARGNSGDPVADHSGANRSAGEAGAVTPQTVTHAFRNATDTPTGLSASLLRHNADGSSGDGRRGRKNARRYRARRADGSGHSAGWKSVEKTPTLLKVLAGRRSG